MILSSQFPVNLQAILKIEKFWTIKNVLIMTFSHVYADDTKDRKAWKSWNPVNSALFPSPEPTAVIVSFWVVLKSLWLSSMATFLHWKENSNRPPSGLNTAYKLEWPLENRQKTRGMFGKLKKWYLKHSGLSLNSSQDPGDFHLLLWISPSYL